jgi:excisionase family DNA binding protein
LHGRGCRVEGYLSTKQVAERVGVTEARVRQLCAEGDRLPGVFKWGRDWVIPEGAVEHFLTTDRDRRWLENVPREKVLPHE